MACRRSSLSRVDPGTRRRCSVRCASRCVGWTKLCADSTPRQLPLRERQLRTQHPHFQHSRSGPLTSPAVRRSWHATAARRSPRAGPYCRPPCRRHVPRPRAHRASCSSLGSSSSGTLAPGSCTREQPPRPRHARIAVVSHRLPTLASCSYSACVSVVASGLPCTRARLVYRVNVPRCRCGADASQLPRLRGTPQISPVIYAGVPPANAR